MIYLAEQLLPFLIAAFVIGLLVGWTNRAPKHDRPAIRLDPNLRMTETKEFS